MQAMRTCAPVRAKATVKGSRYRRRFGCIRREENSFPCEVVGVPIHGTGWGDRSQLRCFRYFLNTLKAHDSTLSTGIDLMGCKVRP